MKEVQKKYTKIVPKIQLSLLAY